MTQNWRWTDNATQTEVIIGRELDQWQRLCHARSNREARSIWTELLARPRMTPQEASLILLSGNQGARQPGLWIDPVRHEVRIPDTHVQALELMTGPEDHWRRVLIATQSESALWTLTGRTLNIGQYVGAQEQLAQLGIHIKDDWWLSRARSDLREALSSADDHRVGALLNLDERQSRRVQLALAWSRQIKKESGAKY